MIEQGSIIRGSVLWGGAILAMALMAVSNQSFWIDEMTCRQIAGSSSVSDFIENIKSEPGSDAQMPVFQLVMFGWDKICGVGERGFRLVNVIFWLIGVAALTFFLKVRGKPAWGVMIAAGTSAFLWYYVNEARPYAMQFAGASCLLVGYWLRVYEETVAVRGWVSWGLLLFGSLLCAGGSLLGAPFVGLVFLCGLYEQWRKKSWFRHKEWVWFGAWCLLLSALAGYYLWTMIEGKGASSANKTSFVSLGFSAFEQLGFMPYGPGRLALRSEGVSSLVPWLVGLAVWMISIGFVLVVGGSQMSRGRLFRGALWRAMFPVVGTVVILVVAGYVGGFRVLGRHFMPVYPILLLVVGSAYVSLWRGNKFERIVGVIIPLLALVGCLVQRYAERHHKDDYRGAVAYVNSIPGDGVSVWWAAAVPIYDFKDSLSVSLTKNPVDETLRDRPRPALVVLSKVDLYDSQGVLREWLSHHDYCVSKELPAFKIYQQQVAEE